MIFCTLHKRIKHCPLYMCLCLACGGPKFIHKDEWKVFEKKTNKTKHWELKHTNCSKTVRSPAGIRAFLRCCVQCANCFRLRSFVSLSFATAKWISVDFGSFACECVFPIYWCVSVSCLRIYLCWTPPNILVWLKLFGFHARCRVGLRCVQRAYFWQGCSIVKLSTTKKPMHI